MKLVLVMLCGLAAIASTLCTPSFAQSVTAYPVLKGSVQQAARPYKIGAGDTLSVHVYNQSELTQPEILVAPDGTANFNTVGNLYVAGKSVPEVQEMLTTAFSDLVKTPRVTVSLGRTRPGILYVAGAVIRPGMIQMATDPKSLTGGAGGQSNGFRAELRLTNALAAAGGLLGSADLSRVVIHRAETNQEETVDLWKLVKDGDNTQDVLLYQGDTIKVPELASAASMSDDDFKQLVRSSIGPGSFPVRMIGYVTKPGL
jgi:polysaccharide biosynthesis/export protein